MTSYEANLVTEHPGSQVGESFDREPSRALATAGEAGLRQRGLGPGFPGWSLLHRRWSDVTTAGRRPAGNSEKIAALSVACKLHRSNALLGWR
jgi:hypothetical protein